MADAAPTLRRLLELLARMPVDYTPAACRSSVVRALLLVDFLLVVAAELGDDEAPLAPCRALLRQFDPSPKLWHWLLATERHCPGETAALLRPLVCAQPSLLATLPVESDSFARLFTDACYVRRAPDQLADVERLARPLLALAAARLDGLSPAHCCALAAFADAAVRSSTGSTIDDSQRQRLLDRLVALLKQPGQRSELVIMIIRAAYALLRLAAPTDRFAVAIDLLATFHRLYADAPALALYQTCIAEMFEEMFVQAPSSDVPAVFTAIEQAIRSQCFDHALSALFCLERLLDNTTAQALLAELSARLVAIIDGMAALLLDGRFPSFGQLRMLGPRVCESFARIVLETRYQDVQPLHITMMLQASLAVVAKKHTTNSSTDDNNNNDDDDMNKSWITSAEFHAAYRLLSAIVTRRRGPALALLPTIFNQACLLLDALIEQRVIVDSSTTTTAAALAQSHERCAESLSRLFSAVGHHQTRGYLAHYTTPLVLHYIEAMQRFAVRAEIKAILDRAMLPLMDVAPEEAIVELNAALQPMGRALFKPLYAQFQKSRYTGKV